MKKIFVILLTLTVCLFGIWMLYTSKNESPGAQSINQTHKNNVENSSLVAQNELEEVLAKELDDAFIAKELTDILSEDILQWKAATIEPEKVTTIIAFAFGNRLTSNGNRLPGPVNEALADSVVKLHEQTQAPVYAQWEIADEIKGRIPAEKLIVINPTLDAQANVVYLSTAGVAAEVVKQVGGDAGKLGKVAVIAFADHLYRCISVSRDAGIDAYAPQGYQMPNVYDKDSGQPWTRDRLTYLVTDIKARITNRFEKMIAQQKVS